MLVPTENRDRFQSTVPGWAAQPQPAQGLCARTREAATCGPVARDARCLGPHRRGVFAKTAVQVSGPGRQMLLVQMRSVRGVCESS